VRRSERTHGSQTVSAAAEETGGDVGKSSRCEALRNRRGREWHKRAANMANAIQPTVLDLDSEKNSAGFQYAEYFGEGALLQFR